MFASQAHSFRMQARLAISLSWIAGYTNILTLLTCGQVTSHVSGTTSQLGRDVAEGRWAEAAYVGALLGAFLLGAALSGVLTEVGRQGRWASIYVLPIAVEAVLLGAFALLVDWKELGELHSPTGLLALTLLPALAMGLQNATISLISGGRVRTTHVTGVMSDLGMETALWALRRRRARGRPVQEGAFATGWRLLLLASIVGSFALGSGLGALAFGLLHGWSMLPAVAFLVWVVAVDFWNPIAVPQSNKDAGGELHEALPAGVAVFHLLAGRRRFGRRPRLPNLTVWVEHLGADVRVVVLDLSGAQALDANGALEIGQLARCLRAQGRDLVLAGVTPQRYASLRASGVLGEVTEANVCSDLDLAAAHGMTLLERTPPAP